MVKGERGVASTLSAGAATAGDAPGKAALVGRGLGWSLLSSLGLRLGSMSLSIVVARLVAPQEYGVFAVALTVWMVLGTLAEFGLGSDLVRAKEPGPRAPTVATLGLVVALAAAVTMALGSPAIADVFNSPESASVVKVMALGVALFGFTIVPAAMLQRAYRQRALFAVNGAGLLVMAVTVVALALLDHGPMALAWGQVASQATIVVGLHVAAGMTPSFGFDSRIARDSLAFCMPLALANVVSWLLLTLDNVIVSRELSPVALGFYVLAFNVSSWPMSAVGQAVRVVALPAFADTDSAVQRNDGLLRSIGPVVLVAGLMGLSLATLAGPVVAVLYGERWAPAAAALAGLAVFGAIRVVLDLITTFLIAAGETRQVLSVQLLWLALMVPAMVFAVREGGLVAAGWAHVAVAVLVVLPAYGFCLRLAGVDLARLVRACLVPLVAVLPAGVVCWRVGTSGLPAPVTLLAGLTCAAVLYVAPLLPWGRNRLEELRNPRAGLPAEERTSR